MSPYSWISAAIGGLLIVVSLILLSGRGSFLLAGYNTMSKSKQEQYDTPALCKFAGKIFMPIAILIILYGFEVLQVLWFQIAGGAVTVALLIFYFVSANGKRFKK